MKVPAPQLRARTHSLPPCGGGPGRGVGPCLSGDRPCEGTSERSARPPTPARPHKGGGRAAAPAVRACDWSFRVRRPLRKQRASKDAPEDACGAARAPWTVLRGPFGRLRTRGWWAFETGSGMQEERRRDRRVRASRREPPLPQLLLGKVARSADGVWSASSNRGRVARPPPATCRAARLLSTAFPGFASKGPTAETGPVA